MSNGRSIPILVALVLSGVLAGCAGGEDEAPPPANQASIPLLYYLPDDFPVEVDHDHSAAVEHAEELNIDFVAYHACTPEGTVASAVRGYTDIAFYGNYAYVGNSRGFCVLDVTVPQKPQFVSQYVGEPAADLEVSEDGTLVFLLTQRNGAPGPAQQGSTDPTDNLPRGVILVDVRDPKNPIFESYYPVPTNGVHTASPYKMGDRQLLFIQTYDWVPPQGLGGGAVPTQNAPLTQRVEITEVSTFTGKRTLVRLATWSLPRPLDQPFIDYFPHDAQAQFHPLLQKHLLYIAYWDAGLVILDVTDPSQPARVGQYSDIAPSIYNQYHDVHVFPELIDGRHITITAPEIPAGTEAGMVRVIDTTDPAKPVQLGTWRLPGNPGTPGGFLYSPHVFSLHEGRVYIGHNHAGVWVIDVHNETLLRDPQSVGFHFPRGDEASGTWSPSASVWGAYFHEGFVYATEGSSGVHVLRFLGDAR